MSYCLTAPKIGEAVPLWDLYNELDQHCLKLQLAMLPVVFPGVTAVTDLIAAFRQKHQEVKMLFGEVERLITLLLVVPVSGAMAECSFTLVLLKVARHGSPLLIFTQETRVVKTVRFLYPVNLSRKRPVNRRTVIYLLERRFYTSGSRS